MIGDAPVGAHLTRKFEGGGDERSRLRALAVLVAACRSQKPARRWTFCNHREVVLPAARTFVR
jgi:hypothetical protein